MGTLTDVLLGQPQKIYDEVMAHREKTLTNWRALARADAARDNQPNDTSSGAERQTADG
jgi:hypothetical protein